MDILIIIYLVFGWAMVLLAALVLIQGFANWNFARKRLLQVRPPHKFTPPVDLVCPCCGLDHDLEKSLRSLLNQNYPDYKVVFTVAGENDPAVPLLRRLTEQFGPAKACLVIAGPARTCAQKVHNQLQAIRQGSRGAEVLAFVDSDINPEPNWLRHLVDPLVRPSVGMVTGYRWYVPIRQNLPTITLSALNAIPGGSLGPHSFNHAWGGTMALRREYFDKLKISDIWSGAITDDLTLSNTLKKAGYKVVFEPKCYSASRDIVSWSRMFEFVRRQFIITRVCGPVLWLIALSACLQYVMAFWAGLALTIYALAVAHPWLHLIWPVPVLLYAANCTKGILRRINIFIALPDHKNDLNLATWVDIFASPIINLIMLICILASAKANTIIWRGTTYRLHRYDKTEVIRN